MSRAVLFDLDDTLLDHRGAAEGAVVAFAAGEGLTADTGELVARWHALTDRHYARYQAREISHAENRRVRVRAFLDRAGVDDVEADRLFARYQRGYRARWRAFDDALSCLLRCRGAGLGVGVLTNGEADIQTDKLRRTGLLGAVDHVVASSELAAAKPDPRAFEAAADRLGVDLSDLLMVGDSLANDVAGALAAGADAVLLDRSARPSPDGVRRIRALGELTP